MAAIEAFSIRNLYTHARDHAKMIHADGEMPQAKDQGARGTCVAFATPCVGSPQ
jgi:hypothetical protein